MVIECNIIIQYPTNQGTVSRQISTNESGAVSACLVVGVRPSTQEDGLEQVLVVEADVGGRS